MDVTISSYLEKLRPLLSHTWARTVMTLFLGILLGSFLFSPQEGAVEVPHSGHGMDAVWTCSMHPQVKLEEPGQCPVCFMDLIPLTTGSGGSRPNEYTLSKAAAQLAKIATTPVRRGMAKSSIRLSGKIHYDETRVKTIAAWFPGRIDRLFVDYTGIKVKRGDHLFEIYSPELFSAQEELLLAHRRSSGMKVKSNGAAGKTAFEAVREKTKLLGLSDGQIDAILKRGSAHSTIQINSPMAGIVTRKNAVEGKYVRTGEQIYSIADLSKVWLILDAYEKDLPWLVYGQELTFTVAGLPGQSYAAHISYIDPLVDPSTHSVTVRAVLDNPQGLLKPGMLAEASISVVLNAAGQVLGPDLSGKWVCPMHPEVMEDHRVDCPVCGMDLVEFAQSETSLEMSDKALLIPASAVLKTGRRSLVYVEVSGSDQLTYEMREIEIGPRVGDDYIIMGGLAEGERVVSNGNFKIDSAMQIAGKASMMSLPQSTQQHTISHDLDRLLDSIYQEYLELQADLAGDDANGSRIALGKLLKQLDAPSFQVENVAAIQADLKTLLDDSRLEEISKMDLPDIRSSFELISQVVLALERTFGHGSETLLYEVYCPMAFENKGASWLQADQDIKNPYFGAAMLKCGEVKQRFAPSRIAHESS